MKIKRKNLISIIENYLGDSLISEQMLNPLMLLLVGGSNNLAAAASPGTAGDLSFSGLTTAASEGAGGILSDFVAMKADAILNSKHIASNTFDKYFHAMGFCLAAMEYTIKSIEDIKEVGERIDKKDQIMADVKKSLRDAGQWKEALYDGLLGLGESSAEDLEANSFGLDQAFDPSW